MPDISLITSLYRSDAFLPAHIRRVRTVATQLAAANLTLELVYVVNDATAVERTELAAFAAAPTVATLQVQPLFVERESIYASWNRGIAAAQANVLGFWNVDDERTAEGLIQAHQVIHAGAQLVNPAFRMLFHGRWLERNVIHPPQYDPNAIGRKVRLGPFFMFQRQLYEAAGAFDPHFRIAGDFDWGMRETIRQTTSRQIPTVAGTFHIHGSNLSGGNTREIIEDNIVFMRRQIWDFEMLRPTADPNAMRAAWDTWGNPGDIRVPDDVQSVLWGERAEQAYAELDALMRMQRRRRIPRLIIDRLGIRPLLASLGIVQPASE